MRKEDELLESIIDDMLINGTDVMSAIEAAVEEVVEAEKDIKDACPEGTPKYTAQEAGYLELEGAVKDGDCKIVYVLGGISKDLGCCNGFRYKTGAEKKFSCGTCTFEI